VKTALQLAIFVQLLMHPGGLDSSGGHHDRRNGGYHYHASHSAGPPINVAAQEAFLAAARAESVRREARTTARLEAREAARLVARQADEDDPQLPAKPIINKNEFRLWTDTTGKFSVEAQFGGYVPERVRLVKRDTTEIHVDVVVLSDSDKAYLRRVLGKSGVRATF
jgi:hypothetical protein